MTKVLKIIFILLILLLSFNKKIISFYYLNKFSNWVEREVTYKELNINYPNTLSVIDLKILNNNEFKNKYLFESKKIIIEVDLRTLLSKDLVIINSLEIESPIFYLDLIQKNESTSENSFQDNIGLAEKINEDSPDKIWPPKRKDKNFLITKIFIKGALANIHIDTINKVSGTKLSDMKFSNIGNEKHYKHYKDVLKLILFDIINRTYDFEIKNKLKEIYKY